MSFVDFIQQYKLLEYILTGAFVIGICVIILFSSPIEKLKDWARKRYKRKRKSQLLLMQEANKALEQQLEKFITEQKDFHDQYIDESREFHAYVESNFDEIHYILEDHGSTLKQLEQSDQEQLRQLMDSIYYKHVNEKKIPQHKFDRYQGLYANYKKEGGNGKYDAQWNEVQKWEKYT